MFVHKLKLLNICGMNLNILKQFGKKNKNVFNYKISVIEIISGIWSIQNLEHIMTLTCFLIYKEGYYNFLMEKINGILNACLWEKRNGILNASFDSNELSLRQKIYLNCKMYDQARNINILIHAFETISAIQRI